MSALALPAAGAASPGPDASPSARPGQRALMPKGSKLVRLTSIGHVDRYDRAQRRLTQHAVRLRHRVADARDRELPRHAVRRMRDRLDDAPPHRLRSRVHALRRELHDARAEAAAAPASASPALEAIAACESGGDPAANTGNGFYGKYQFTQATWESIGGTGNPAAAGEAEQDRRAAMLYAQQGASPWPVCGR
jgi:hypothetical protein